MPQRTTAALIVIGDEILKGSTIDTNSGFLASRLHKIGVQLKRVSVIGDDVEDISEEISRFSKKFEIVFTTGGVGPTHDDKTYLGLAKAFNADLEASPDILNAVSKYMHNTSAKNESFALKLSNIPVNSKLLWGSHPLTGASSPFPIVRFHNVIAFPGVPAFFERAFDSLKNELFPPEKYPTRFSETVYTSLDEFQFSSSLDRIAEKYDGVVEIGSYPVIKNKYYKTKLIIESDELALGQDVIKEIQDFLHDAQVYYDEAPWDSTVIKMETFIRRQEDDFSNKIRQATDIIDKILDEYSLEEIALSFNGGKDCTVLLHFLRLAVDKKYGAGKQLQGFHIMCDDQFPEATQFIIDAARNYNIIVHELPGPLKVGLERLKVLKPKITAVLMGSRLTDPKGKYMKSPTQWTDNDWPTVLRVCPVLYWSYQDVWKALRGLCIPYCILYDMGYTSLGGRENTFKNPKLKVSTPDGKEKYLPAFMLQESDFERNGRE
ncbi:unnamed protein product [Auanema sp. JU1783]|nr:unnamed protein product [Auanema sp. JU1783]